MVIGKDRSGFLKPSWATTLQQVHKVINHLLLFLAFLSDWWQLGLATHHRI